jgi:hypothetical protein
MRIWIRNIAFFLANLRICDFRTGIPRKLGGFAICRLIITNLRIYDLPNGTPQKFVNLLLRNYPKNLRICDLRTSKRNLRVDLWEPSRNKVRMVNGFVTKRS